MAIFKCFASDFEQLEKKINHITKKLDKHNVKWNFKKLAESIEMVNVYDYTNYDNIPSWQFTPKNMGTIAVDVITYEFEMEVLKLGEYTPIAVIEHNAITGNENLNLIHVLQDNEIIPVEYRTVESKCEHCNTKHNRNKTILLKDINGNYKQVGTSCIKEFTGIEGIDIIKNYQEISDIMVDKSNLSYDYANKPQSQYITTIEYLTSCIDHIKQNGYVKDTTKNKAWDNVLTNNYNNEHKELAQNIIDYFINKDIAEYDNFLNNIKVSLTKEFTKLNGFIAYSYIAYQKQIEIDRKKEAEKQITQNSQYIGNIGDKIQITVTLNKHITFDTMYGTQHIYLFTDKEGNIYKWKSSTWLKLNGESYINIKGNINELVSTYLIDSQKTITLKGTIKGHEEYNNTKQTELTRCKIAE